MVYFIVKGEAIEPIPVIQVSPKVVTYRSMVIESIKELKNRSGSSLHAIKKYMACNYKIDIKRCASFIRKAITNGVASGALVQIKGTGACGSFKISGDNKRSKRKAKKPATKRNRRIKNGRKKARKRN